MQFTEPSDRPDDDLALYDAVARTGHVILATGESDGRGGTRVLGGEEQLEQAGGAVAASSTFPNDAGGVIRRVASADAGLATIAAVDRAAARRPKRPREALIDFRGPPGTIPTYSFVDVLQGRVGARELRGKTVVVGASAPVLQDVHPTSAPGEKLMSGPELQANAIWTAVHGGPLRRVPGLGRRAAGPHARRPGHAGGAGVRPRARRRRRAAARRALRGRGAAGVRARQRAPGRRFR